MQLTNDTPTRREAHASLLVLAAALVVGTLVAFFTYSDYGPAYDAAFQAKYGELALRYFESGDTSCNEFHDLRFYGPLFEMLPAWIYEGTELHKYEVRHLFFGLLMLTCLPAVWLFARKFGDPWVAIFAVLAVVALPRFYGHWFNNSKDASFALCVTWFLWSVAHLFQRSRLPWSRAILCGIAMGLALCSRVGGFPLFVLFLGTGAGLWWLGGRDRNTPWTTACAQLATRSAVVVLVAWPVMVAPLALGPRRGRRPSHRGDSEGR